MAIGLVFGPGEFEQGTFEERPLAAKSKELPRGLPPADKVCQRFIDKFGSLRCRDVQVALHGKSWDFSNPVELSEYFQPRIHDKCGEVTKAAAEFAADVGLKTGDQFGE